MKGLIAAMVVSAIIGTGGCARLTPQDVAEPSGVTLQAAVIDVTESIAILQKVPPEERAGLLLDEVTVTFNIAASANSLNRGQVTLSATPNPAVTLGATGDVQLTNDGSRGNQIIMKFKNLATADFSKGSFATPGTGDHPGAAQQGSSASGSTSQGGGSRVLNDVWPLPQAE